jgi:hypothetical protein
MGVVGLPGATRGDAPHQMCTDVAGLELRQFEYLGDGKICVTSKTDTGQVIVSVMTASAFLNNLNLATEFLNKNLAEILSHIKVF